MYDATIVCNLWGTKWRSIATNVFVGWNVGEHRRGCISEGVHLLTAVFPATIIGDDEGIGKSFAIASSEFVGLGCGL